MVPDASFCVFNFTMKFYCIVPVLFTFLEPIKIATQNYYYVHGNFSSNEKMNIRCQLKYCAELFDTKNVTIADFKSKLPRNFNATIECQPNQQVRRKKDLD